MNEIVVVKKNEMFTTSLAISEGVGLDHSSVFKMIKKYSYTEILLGFEIQKLSTKGRPIEVAYLTELQATFLITLMKNSELVIQFKEKLTKAFFKQRKLLEKLLSRKDNADWLAKRQETKIVRLEETDIIKKFVNYATEQGSKSAYMYYMNISKMENKSLFLIDQKYKNIRDIMDFRQLNLIQMADEAIKTALEDGMSANLHYKAIYKLAKEKIEAIAKIFPPSPLPALLNITNQLE